MKTDGKEQLPLNACIVSAARQLDPWRSKNTCGAERSSREGFKDVLTRSPQQFQTRNLIPRFVDEKGLGERWRRYGELVICCSTEYYCWTQIEPIEGDWNAQTLPAREFRQLRRVWNELLQLST